MALDATLNFGKATVSIGYAAGATSIVLTAGHGAKFPDPAVSGEFNLVWWNFTDYLDPSDDTSVEIVRCTARSTDTLTVTRAQEGTADVNHNTGGKTYKMFLGMTDKMIDDIGAAYLQLLGRSGGQTAIGGLDSGDDLTLNSTSHATKGNIIVPDGEKLSFGTGLDGNIYASSDDLYIENDTVDKDIIFKVNDGSVDTEVMRIDGSVSNVQIGGTTAALTKLYVYNDAMVTTESGMLLVGRSAITAGIVRGLQMQARTNAASTGATFIGVDGSVVSNNTDDGFATNARGLHGSVTSSGQGTITNAMSIYAAAPTNTGGGTMNNAYSVWIGSPTVGSTLNYGLYQPGTTINRINGQVGIGTSPTAPLHVDQSSASAAIPVLKLDQGDIDDTFIDFIGTSAADGSRSISSDTTENSAKFGAIRVEINGVTKWIRIYDDES